MNNLDHISKAVKRARQQRAAAGAIQEAKSKSTQLTYNQTRIEGVSADSLREQRIIAGVEDAEHLNSYKMLRTTVLRRLQKNGWRVFGVTSSAPGEGKTLTAINLSISLAMQASHTVLLIDADLHRPSIHKYFDYKPQSGLGSYLLSGAPVEEVFVYPEMGRFIILPTSEPIHNASEHLCSPRMEALLEELKTRYPSRIIIFDLPPLLATDDVMACSNYLDSVLLVVEDGNIAREKLARSAELLKETNVLGVVLNKSKDPEAGYGAYY